MYTQSQREAQREANKKWYYKNREKHLATTKKYQHKVREIVLKYYGGRCECCSESKIPFLSIDHRNGGGGKHRKELGFSGIRFYFWLRKNNYPESFRVLCHNCNQAMAWNRKCPHELLKT